MIDFIDKTTNVAGTPINRANMMAIQNFEPKTVVFNADGSITEINKLGQTLTTSFPSFGKIVEKFVGSKTIVLTTTFTASGFKEELS